MKLTKEFIKNEIKRLLSEVGGGYEGPVGFAGRPAPPPGASAEFAGRPMPPLKPSAPEATGPCKMPCKTAADCKKTTGHAKLEPRYSSIVGALDESLPLPGETTGTVKEAIVEQEWDCVKNCCVPVQRAAVYSTETPTEEETKQFYGCYARLWEEKPEMMRAMAAALHLRHGHLVGARKLCLENAKCRHAVLEQCKQATPVPPMGQSMRGCVKACPPGSGPMSSPEYPGGVCMKDNIPVAILDTEGNAEYCKKRASEAGGGVKPPKRRGGGGCGRRWISISSSSGKYAHIKVCVLLPSKARRIQGGGATNPDEPPAPTYPAGHKCAKDPTAWGCGPGVDNACIRKCHKEAKFGAGAFNPCKAACKKTYSYRVDRLWDTDPESSDNEAFAGAAFKAIDPILTAVGYTMTESGGFELEKASGRDVFVAYYDLNPDLTGDREARREARKARRQISRNRKDMWYDIYNKAKDELVHGAAGQAGREQAFASKRVPTGPGTGRAPTAASDDLELPFIKGLNEVKTIRIRKKNK